MKDVIRRIWSSLPRGGSLPEDVWSRRQQGIVVLLWLHVLAIVVGAVVARYGWRHGLLDASPIVIATLVAGSRRPSRSLRSAAATLGLVTCSAVLTHLAGGLIEMHFHFFVVIGIISLYQDWKPFLLALSYVVVHHGLLGALDGSVFDHADARSNPWMWALIHGGFVLAASLTHLTAWRLNEEGFFQDALTKLPNRRLFEDRLTNALQRAERNAAPVSVVFIDLDDFKTVNDSLGHGAGDDLLLAVAERLTRCVRAGDTAARLGGDEFAILLEGAGQEQAVAVARRLLGALRAPLQLHGRELFLTASIGIADNTTLRDAAELLRDADAAMYAAKRNGKARYEVYESGMHSVVLNRLELLSELQGALQREEFTVHYQPTFELATGRVVGVEALVRWQHPQRGLVPPLEFIPLAEETGLIVPLGRWVLREACRQVQRWNEQSAHCPPLKVNVNLSASQLQVPCLLDDVRGALRESGLDPACLILEITESVLAHDPEATIARLNQLKALGLSLAIDDFGTGYSSLSYLHRFPIDVLKIDKSFIDTITRGPEESAITRAVVKLGPALGLQVAAEGIETAEQLRVLKSMHCDQGQGYFFAKPQDAARIEALLQEQAARNTPAVARVGAV